MLQACISISDNSGDMLRGQALKLEDLAAQMCFSRPAGCYNGQCEVLRATCVISEVTTHGGPSSWRTLRRRCVRADLQRAECSWRRI